MYQLNSLLSIFFNLVNMIKTKRIYDTPSAEDGYRILVDKLWPEKLTAKAAKKNRKERKENFNLVLLKNGIKRVVKGL